MRNKNNDKKPRTDEVDLTNIQEKNFIQRLGSFIHFMGGIVMLFGIGMVYKFVKDLINSELQWGSLLGIPLIFIGIAIFSFGEWLRTPKQLRGKYRLFYD